MCASHMLLIFRLIHSVLTSSVGTCLKVSERQGGPLQAWVTYQAFAVTLAQKTADL